MEYPKPEYRSGVKFLSVEDSNGKIQDGFYMFECPGCGHHHFLNVDEKRILKWEFNFDFVKPTVRPSFSVKIPIVPGSITDICHFFITDGKMEFLSDCTHDKAGKTINMIDVVKV